MTLFKLMSIWRRLGPRSAIRYVCFYDMSNEQYAVQSADFFRLPIDEAQLRASERQLVELFIEDSVLDRCAWFGSVEQAVLSHDTEFGNDDH